MIENNVGFGRIIINKEGSRYEGTIPFEKSEDVAMVRVSDLVKLVKAESNMVFQSTIEMDPQFYDVNSQTTLPDEIIYRTTKDQVKLFLDRNFYSLNPNKYLLARWTSIDADLAESKGGRNEKNKS